MAPAIKRARPVWWENPKPETCGLIFVSCFVSFRFVNSFNVVLCDVACHCIRKLIGSRLGEALYYDTIRYDTIRYDTIRYDTSCCQVSDQKIRHASHRSSFSRKQTVDYSTQQLTQIRVTPSGTGGRGSGVCEGNIFFKKFIVVIVFVVVVFVFAVFVVYSVWFVYSVFCVLCVLEVIR